MDLYQELFENKENINNSNYQTDIFNQNCNINNNYIIPYN